MSTHTETDHAKNGALRAVSGFVMGFAFGSVVAMLFTPISGKAARGRVKDAVDQGKAKVAESAEIARKQTADAFNTIVAQASSAMEQGKHRIALEGRRLAAAASAGKEAYLRGGNGQA
jgi:gas vesicle protein